MRPQPRESQPSLAARALAVRVYLWLRPLAIPPAWWEAEVAPVPSGRVRVVTPEDQAELDAVDGAWLPFSPNEQLWHACPGHEWVRLTWFNGRRDETITRCQVCGAPRCDAYSFVGKGWSSLTDHSRQLYRCTLERHHPVGTDLGPDEGHDYLT